MYVDQAGRVVETFERNAMTCSCRLLSVPRGLTVGDTGLPADDASGEAADVRTVKARVARNADVRIDVLGQASLPLSRLDNIASALVVEVEGLVGRLAQFNERYATLDEAALNRMKHVTAGNVALQENAASFRHRHDADHACDLNDA